MDKPSEIVGYWFESAADDAVIDPSSAAYRRWFARSAEVDAHIVAAFGDDVEAARAGRYDAWRTSAREALALVLLLDQFPRHIWRGQRAAFASDEIAFAIARACIESKLDEALPLCQRVFMYLPIQHSEQLSDHDLALQRFTALVDAARASGAKILSFCEAAVKSEIEHADTLRQFGRYPYRNDALGRASTVAETEWLATRSG